MSAATSALALRAVYRDDVVAGGVSSASGVHLAAASDALIMALLSLSGYDEDRGGKFRNAAQARGFLAEALTSLSRARIYLPGIRTHSLAVLMSTEPDGDAEVQRLHQIATRMLWQNHAYLPARSQAEPLAPEEEAQLAVVLAGLARNARIDRALRFKWIGLAAAVATACPMLGFPALGVAAAGTATALGLWKLLRGRARVVSPA